MSANVLVAGARGGIGGAVIDELHSRGHRTFGVDRDDFDICEPGGAERAVAAAREALGDLDGVVHAIGMSGRRLGDASVVDCTDEAWAEVHRVNLESAFRLVRAGMPHLCQRGTGSIVIIGSGLAHTIDDDFLTVAYATAKAALVPLVRSAAHTGAQRNVRVNLVSPGVVDTAMARRAIDSPELGPRLATMQPLTRGAQSATSVAQTVAWLLSDDASVVTGADIPADGGWTLR